MRLKFIPLIILFYSMLAWAQHTYVTNFDNAETPISEGNNWVNGKTAGLVWSDVRTASGRAYGNQTVDGTYNDSTAILTGTWGAAQSAQGVVYANPNTGQNIEEIEIRLRSYVAANVNQGYEVLCRVGSGGNGYAALVRWNGPKGGAGVGFDNVSDINAGGGGGCNHGDVWTASVDASNNFRVWRNGTALTFVNTGTTTVQDNTHWTAAWCASNPGKCNPGIGFYRDQSGTGEANFGFTSFAATDTGTIRNAATCNSTDINTQLGLVGNDADIVVVPAGPSCSWTHISYTRAYSVTLMGQSKVAGTCAPGGTCTATNNTVVTATVPNSCGSSNCPVSVTIPANKTFRFTGFTISLTATPGDASYGAMNFNGAVVFPGTSQVRIDHNHITDNVSGDHTFHTDNAKGVFDHNLFEGSGGTVFNLQILDPGASGLGQESWNQSESYGTDQSMFMENNVFNGQGAFAFDCHKGGRLVFRYNVTGTHNKAMQTHGTGSGDISWRGCKQLEIYGNSFAYSTTPASDSFAFANMFEGGTGLAFNNTITAFCTFLAPDYVRDNNNTYSQSQPPQGLGYCASSPIGGISGPSNWDQNTTGQNGYACLDGVGRGRGDLLSGGITNDVSGRVNVTRANCGPTQACAWPRQDLVPFYTWSNTLNSSSYCASHMWGTDPRTTANRDYFDATGASCTAGGSCTTGVGTGTTLPTSCTTNATTDDSGNHPGVGFFKTDTNTLYRCTSTTPPIWTAYYQPYTYPHPLTGGTVQTLTSTTTTLTSSPNPSYTGQSVTFTATVTPSGPTGTVTFFDGATSLSTVALAGGSASYPTSALTAGTHSITATYNGDTNYSGSTSSPVSQRVDAPAVQLTPNPRTFTDTIVGQNSTAVITLTNTGVGTLTMSAPAFSGTNSADFSLASTTCGANLPGGSNAQCTYTIRFTPGGLGGRTGFFDLTSNAPTSVDHVTLNGNGISGGTAVISVDKTSLTWTPPTSRVGQSYTQNVQVSNSGPAGTLLHILGINESGAHPGDFSESGCGAGTALNGGQSCTLTVTFTPTQTGSRTATLTILNDDGAAPTISLTGTGTQPNPVLTTLSDFGNVTVGMSGSQTATLSNNGTYTDTLNIPANGITATGDFSIGSKTCGTQLGANQTCTIQVTFTPTTTGPRSGTFTVTDSDGIAVQGSPQTLSGTGVTPTASITPTSIAFDPQSIGSLSIGHDVTLTNTGLGILNNIVIQLVGTNPGDFQKTTTCASSLQPSQSCTVTVKFLPTVPPGTKNARLQFSDNATPSPQTVDLTGIAVSAQGKGMKMSGKGTISGVGQIGLIAISLTTIDVEPNPASISTGETQQFTATGYYSNNSQQDLTSVCAWVSSAPTIATITSAGLASGIAVGTTNISCTYQSITSSQAVLTVVFPVTLLSIEVSPTVASILVAGTQQYAAMGNYSDDTQQDLTSVCVWVSSDTNKATINANTGLATGVALGTTNISCSYSSITSNTAVLNIVATVACGPPWYNCSSNYTGTVQECNSPSDPCSTPTYPNVGALTGAGTLVYESTFLTHGATAATPICRITDANTDLNGASAYFMTDVSGGGPAIFNKDSTIIMVLRKGNTPYFISGNWDTCTINWVKRPPTPIDNRDFAWSTVDAHKLWARHGTVIETITVDANGNWGAYTPQFDFANTNPEHNPAKPQSSPSCLPAGYPTAGTYKGNWDVTEGDDPISSIFSPTSGQGSGYELVSWKIGSGCSYLNTTTGAMRSDWSFNGTVAMSMTGTIHDGGAIPNPNYVGFSFNGSPSNALWDVANGTEWQCNANGQGCSGHATKGRTAWFKGAADLGLEKRPYTHPWDRTPETPPLPAGAQMHATYNNADANDTYPFFFYTSASPKCESSPTQHPYPPNSAYYNEIAATIPDGSKTTKRITHNFNSGFSSSLNIACNPTSSSPNGKYLAFTSDWEESLGCDNGSQTCTEGVDAVHRSDVFIAIPQ